MQFSFSSDPGLQSFMGQQCIVLITPHTFQIIFIVKLPANKVGSVWSSYKGLAVKSLNLT